MSQDFFANLPTLASLQDLGAANFFSVPEDWVILLTDVQGSTKAIAEGRYKEVNMVGAACIIAVLNELRPLKLPFVFGGDGATVLVPEARMQNAMAALAAVKTMAQEHFGLKLRMGAVKLSEIRSRGAAVEVARVRGGGDNGLAFFRGGGLQAAEMILKENHVEVASTAHNETARLDGLECRWNPIANSKGEILTLIAMGLGDQRQNWGIYQRLVDEIGRICGGEVRNPVRAETLPLSWPPRDLGREIELRRGRLSPWQLWKETVKILAQTFLAMILIRFRIPLGHFRPEEYLASLSQHSDFLKTDDALRMVLDCSKAEREGIMAVLSKAEAAGEIVFGTHTSSHALMTCMVRSFSDHFHLVDGEGGGYVQAAKQVKNKLKR